MKLQALLGLCAHSICASGDIVDSAYTVLVFER
jgi:hypothetical protein